MPAFYALWISNTASRQRGTALCWGPRRDSAKAARSDLKAALTRGEATLGTVAVLDGDRRELLANYVLPLTAERIIGHWIEMSDALENQP